MNNQENMTNSTVNHQSNDLTESQIAEKALAEHPQ